MPKFPKNKHFLPPDTHTFVSGGKKCLFFGNFGVVCFLETPVLRFALLPYYRRINLIYINLVIFIIRSNSYRSPPLHKDHGIYGRIEIFYRKEGFVAKWLKQFKGKHTKIICFIFYQIHGFNNKEYVYNIT